MKHRRSPRIPSRQLRPLRVRQPGPPGHRHAHRELHPAAGPAAGPNFFEFGDDVRYEIHISNGGDGPRRRHLPVHFTTEVLDNPKTFLYNTGPITSLSDPNFNRRQHYTVTRATARRRIERCWAIHLASPPVQHRATVDAELPGAGHGGRPRPRRRAQGLRRPARRRVLRRPRLGVRPARPAPVPEPAPHPERRRLRAWTTSRTSTSTASPSRCRSAELTAAARPPTHRSPTRSSASGPRPAGSARWSATTRRRRTSADRWVQVSRLGNPLVNEALIPMGRKDEWNRPIRRTTRSTASTSTPRAAEPPAGPLPGGVPEPGCAQPAARADLVAILLTGMPAGIIPGFQNYTGKVHADTLRLNSAIPPAADPAPCGRPGRRPGRLPQRPPCRSTTSWPSSCGPSPGSPTRWWRRRTRRTRRPVP